MTKTTKKGYYNEKTLAKFTEAFKAAKAALDNGEEINVHFSASNRKMGAVASVSTLPFLTCPSVCKDTCGKYCYAVKIANLYSNVLKTYAENTVLAMYRPSQYWEAIRDCCAGHTKQVRFCTRDNCALYPYRMGKRPQTENEQEGKA